MKFLSDVLAIMFKISIYHQKVLQAVATAAAAAVWGVQKCMCRHISPHLHLCAYAHVHTMFLFIQKNVESMLQMSLCAEIREEPC